MQDSTIATGLRARDFMQTDVLTVAPESSILDIHRLFVEEEIHGAPVVDENGVVRGVVSTLDLLRCVSEEADEEGAGLSYFRGEGWTAPDTLPARLTELTAADVMTRGLVVVSPDTKISDVAAVMREQHVHRVLVIEERELRGVLTTFDLLRAFLDSEPVQRRNGWQPAHVVLPGS